MQVRLIVPCEANGRRVDPTLEYGQRIASIAGGFTAFPAVGGWVDAAGKLIVEPVTVFDIAGDDVAYRLRDLARDIRRDLNQDCVYLSIDGVVEFVK